MEYQQFLKDVKDKPLRLISFGFVKTEHWITIALYTVQYNTDSLQADIQLSLKGLH